MADGADVDDEPSSAAVGGTIVDGENDGYWWGGDNDGKIVSPTRSLGGITVGW